MNVCHTMTMLRKYVEEPVEEGAFVRGPYVLGDSVWGHFSGGTFVLPSENHALTF